MIRVVSLMVRLVIMLSYNYTGRKAISMSEVELLTNKLIEATKKMQEGGLVPKEDERIN